MWCSPTEVKGGSIVPAIGRHLSPPGTSGPPPAVSKTGSMTPLDLVNLTQLMAVTSGAPEIVIGLIDGPVALNHPALSRQNVREIPGRVAGSCTQATSSACIHGTLVAGILSARRDSPAPAICPACTLLVRPIFRESVSGQMASAAPDELAAAILDCIDAGARVINLSIAFSESRLGEAHLQQALDHAAKHGVIVVAAAGNQGSVGSSVISAHPGVVPVAAYSLRGIPLSLSNLGRSIGLRGIGAPGEAILSIGAGGAPLTFGGTSAAAAFVTGAIALLWSEFASASAAGVRSAVSGSSRPRRTTIVPPLLNAWAAFQGMTSAYGGRTN